MHGGVVCPTVLDPLCPHSHRQHHLNAVTCTVYLFYVWYLPKGYEATDTISRYAEPSLQKQHYKGRAKPLQ